jgi:CRISPR-associated endonuclease/helicase Cas3
VAGLDHPDALPVLGAPYYFDRVYEPYVLLRTWAVLRTNDRFTLPADVDRAVQAVYSDDLTPPHLPAGAEEALQTAKRAFDEAQEGDEADAAKVVAGEPDDDTWETVPILKRKEQDDLGHFLPVLTRKGRESIIAVPLYPHGVEYSLDPAGQQQVSLTHRMTIDEAKAVYLRSVSLSRPEVVRGLRSQACARTGWANTPLLRDCYPLVLDDLQNVFERVRVQLDEDVGIEYHRVDGGD